jgi:hypothetical protein
MLLYYDYETNVAMPVAIPMDITILATPDRRKTWKN